MKYIFMGLFSLFFLSSCSMFMEPKELPLLAHDGYAFDIMINKTPVIELSRSENIPALTRYNDKESIHWKSMKPISGAISIEIKRKYIKAYNIGHINPLDYQLSCERLASENNRTDTIQLRKNEPLPNGNYVITVKIHGTKGWDSKKIYVEVKANAIQNRFL